MVNLFTRMADPLLHSCYLASWSAVLPLYSKFSLLIPITLYQVLFFFFLFFLFFSFFSLFLVCLIVCFCKGLSSDPVNTNLSCMCYKTSCTVNGVVKDCKTHESCFFLVNPPKVADLREFNCLPVEEMGASMSS